MIVMLLSGYGKRLEQSLKEVPLRMNYYSLIPPVLILNHLAKHRSAHPLQAGSPDHPTLPDLPALMGQSPWSTGSLSVSNIHTGSPHLVQELFHPS